ncbi:hypothetical protein V8C86DRAFT_2749718 [Haematococcus lacustris]
MVLGLDRVGQACFQLLEEASKSPTTSAERVDELLASLAHIYGRNFWKALEIVDQGLVACLQGEQSGRQIFQVQGKTAADKYLVFPAHFCSCQAFFYEVVNKGEAVCCKHQLAARVSWSLQRCPVLVVSDVQLAQFLINAS